MTKTTEHMQVSIGLPVYNGEAYLAQTLDSLRAQTFEDFQVIISDNASTDQTREICLSYASMDPRLRYVCNTANLGAARNYRRAFELSSGKYFRWANCDDLFAPESLARCVAVLDQQPEVVLTYPKTKFIDAHGRLISEYDDGLDLQSPRASVRFAQLWQRVGFVNAIYGLMRADTLKRTKLIGNYLGADIVFLAELTLYGKFFEIPEFLFYRRLHPNAYSSQHDLKQMLEFYDPVAKPRLPLLKWKRSWENLLAVERAPLGITEKLLLLSHIARMGIWDRNELMRELSAAVRQALRFPV
jgi:glycosyltransferase involved in cell wall biosynthesis